MNFTVGLVIVFFNVFVPGLLFLRFYFLGEFSKQFNTRIPIIRLGFYALIPGLIIQSIGLLIYDYFIPDFKIIESLKILNELFNSSIINYSKSTKFFLKSELWIYVLYTVISCISAILSALLFYYLVRKFRLDIKFKILRFKNQWFYIFSGDYTFFEKYQRASSNLVIDNPSIHKDLMMVYADILVSNNGNTKMYTGYVVDYDLDHNDINKLDKIYLKDVLKYKYKNTEKTDFDTVPIPGDLFIIDNSQVVNINLTFIPSIIEIEKNETKKERNNNRLFVLFTFIYLTIFVCSLLLFYANFPKIDFLSKYLSQLGFFKKSVLCFTIIQFFAYIYQVSELKLVKMQKDLNEKKIRTRKYAFRIFIFLLVIYIISTFI
jgi:hypothetical protein